MPRPRRPGPDWDPNGPRRVRSPDRPPTLDLGAPDRAAQVLRIAGSHPEWRTCLAAGWDRDDLQQEVLLRVLERQRCGPNGGARPTSAYDPERSSVAKYLHVLTQSLLRNLRVLQRTLGAPAEVLLGEGERIEQLEDPPDEDEVHRRCGPLPSLMDEEAGWDAAGPVRAAGARRRGRQQAGRGTSSGG